MYNAGLSELCDMVHYGEQILTIAVMAILLTAPLGEIHHFVFYVLGSDVFPSVCLCQSVVPSSFWLKSSNNQSAFCWYSSSNQSAVNLELYRRSLKYFVLLLINQKPSLHNGKIPETRHSLPSIYLLLWKVLPMAVRA